VRPRRAHLFGGRRDSRALRDAYFCFKDIDENKPTGSIRIRVETIGYFLKRYREDIVRNKQKTNTIEQQLKEFEARLRRQMLRDRMDDSRVQDSFDNGSMPQIHVSVGHWRRPRRRERG